jgi:hypothetical protein
LIIDVLLALAGVALGWGLKSLSDYLGMRRGEMRTCNKAVFFILRAWKSLLDYDRGTDYFRAKKPSPEEFEPWRAILAEKFVENFEDQSETVSEAARTLAEIDPALATRLDSTIRRVLMTFSSHIADISKSDPGRYRELIYNQDYIIDLTLSDFEKVANTLASRSSLLQRLHVFLYFRSVRKRTAEFNQGMKEQDAMLSKVIDP